MKKLAKKPPGKPKRHKRAPVIGAASVGAGAVRTTSSKSDVWAWLGETYSLVPLFKKSYVLSRFWAWCSRIELSPKLRIPVPRYLSYRDP